MKSKAPLALMEQVIMLLVFALAAAMCLQIFILSDKMSRNCEARDRAVIEVQNMAETLKICRGDTKQFEQLLGIEGKNAQWQLGYDSQWRKISLEQAEYQILVTLIQTDVPTLGSAEIFAQTAEGETLFQVTVSWQEALDG